MSDQQKFVLAIIRDLIVIVLLLGNIYLVATGHLALDNQLIDAAQHAAVNNTQAVQAAAAAAAQDCATAYNSQIGR